MSQTARHGAAPPVVRSTPAPPASTSRQDVTVTARPFRKARGHSSTARPRSTSIRWRIGADAASEIPAVTTTGVRVGPGVGDTGDGDAVDATGPGVRVGAGAAVAAVSIAVTASSWKNTMFTDTYPAGVSTKSS